LTSIDVDGCVIFEGKVNENYKINGENVSPFFIAQVILDCKEVV
jgi:hypothetical protein